MVIKTAIKQADKKLLAARGFVLNAWPKGRSKKYLSKRGRMPSRAPELDYGTPELQAYKRALAGEGNPCTLTALTIDRLYGGGYLNHSEYKTAFHYRLLWQRVMRHIEAPKVAYVPIGRIKRLKGACDAHVCGNAYNEDLLAQWIALQDGLNKRGQENANLVNNVILYDQRMGSVGGKIRVIRWMLEGIEKHLYSKDFKNSGRRPSGKPDEHSGLCDRGRVPKVNAPET